MMEEREVNYLGALLHDIGKFKWRSQEIKAGDDHEKLGEEFIREYLGKVVCLKPHIEEIIAAANRRRGKIWKADIVAAQEREDSEDKAPRRYLESIANRVSISELKNKSNNYWYFTPSPSEIESDEFVFPKDSGKSLSMYDLAIDEYLGAHKKSWNWFVSEVSLLSDTKDPKVFINTFYGLLEKYTSNVLSAGYLSHPDISLYDHSRFTAALSLCIEEATENEECILIQGDISGIQNYIYNGIHEASNAAKRLRGRSFFVSMLTDVIFEYTLSTLNIFLPNLIYNGGGHFIMLAPNNAEIRNKLSLIDRDVNLRLYQRFGGTIGFSLGSVDVTAEMLVNEFGDCFQMLGLELGRKKNLRSFENLEYILNDFVNADLIRKRELENLAMEIQIGKQLPKLKYLCMVSSCKNPNSLNDLEIAFPEFDFSIHLCKNVSDVETLVSRNSGADIKVLSVNNTEFLQEFDRGIFDQVSKGFRFIGNYVPMDSSNNPLTFEEIAKINSANYPLLGILRMDVDNLGAIFSVGLKAENDKEKKYTPSRVACLSRSLNNFFTGRINHLAKKHSIYLAYSGGDDVFAVGSWINILHFSLDLREEFDRFACLNQNMSISAGVIFTKPNFPISESAKLAGEQEHLAKKTNPAIVKNRVSIFDIQMTWEEFKDYSSWAEELSEALLSEEDKDTKLKIPRSFIHSLLSLTKKSFSEDGKINIKEFKRSSTKILYQFARRNCASNLLESEQTGDLNKYLTSLALKFLKSGNKQDFQRKFQFPASIILFKTRR